MTVATASQSTPSAPAAVLAGVRLEATAPPQSLPPAIGALLARGEATHARRAGEVGAELAQCSAEHEAAAVALALRQLAGELEKLSLEPFEPLGLLDTLSGRRKSAQDRFVVQYARIVGALTALRSQVRPLAQVHQRQQPLLRRLLVELHLERQCLARLVERVGVLLSHLARTLRSQGPVSVDGGDLAQGAALRRFGREARTQLAQLGEVSTLALEVHKCGHSVMTYRVSLLKRIEGEFESNAKAWQEQMATLAQVAEGHSRCQVTRLEAARQANARLLHTVVDLVAASGLLERMELLLRQELSLFAQELRRH